MEERHGLFWNIEIGGHPEVICLGLQDCILHPPTEEFPKGYYLVKLPADQIRKSQRTYTSQATKETNHANQQNS